MADSDFLTLDFSNQVPKDSLTQIGAGISDIAHEREAARILKLNQLDYDKSLQRYMDDPNEDNLMSLNQTAIPLGLTDQTTAAVGQVQQIRATRAAAELHEQQMATYNDAMNTFSGDKSNENLQAWLDAGIPLGRFQEVLDTVDKLTEREMQNDVEEAVSILAYLRADRPEEAAAQADLLAESYSNMGDEESLATAAGYRETAKRIRAGEGDDIDTFLSLTVGVRGDPGKTALDNLNNFQGQQRSETELALDIFSKGAALELHPSDLISARNAADMDPEWGALYNTILDYAQVLREAPDEGPSPNEVATQMLKLQDRFFARTEGLRAAGLAVADINSAYQRTIGSDGGAGTGEWTDPDTGQVFSSIGLDDLALINKFQRMIDPATVRKDDFDNIIGTEGAAGRIRVWMNNLVGGVKLSPAQRAEIVALSRAFHEAQMKAVDEDVFPALEAARGALNSAYGEEKITYDTVFGDFVRPEVRAKEAAELQTYKEDIANRILPDNPEVALRRMEGMTREEIDDPAAFGGYLRDPAEAEPVARTGNELEDFKVHLLRDFPSAVLDGYTLEQLKTANPGSYKTFTEQGQAPANAGDYEEIDLDG